MIHDDPVATTGDPGTPRICSRSEAVVLANRARPEPCRRATGVKAPSTADGGRRFVGLGGNGRADSRRAAGCTTRPKCATSADAGQLAGRQVVYGRRAWARSANVRGSLVIRDSVTPGQSEECTMIQTRLLVFLGMIVGLFSCSDGGDGGAGRAEAPCEKLCREIDSRCGTNDYEGCSNTLCDLMIPPAGCFDALESAPCAQVNKIGEVTDVCFPPCSTRDATCQGDQVTQCTEVFDDSLRAVTSDCRRICEAKGKSYSGVCSDHAGAHN